MSAVPFDRRRGARFRLAAFVSRVRVWACLLATLLALALQPVAPARAACEVADVLDAMKTAGETTYACQPVCQDKYRCYAAAGLAIVLTEISRKKDQTYVDSFCNSVTGTLEDILGKLKVIGDLTDGQISQLSDAMKGLGDVISVVNCACKTEQLQLKNEASLGACANAVLGAIGCGELDWSTATVGGCDPVGGFVGGLVNDGIEALIGLGCGWAWDCADGTAGPPTSNCIPGTQADQQGKCQYCFTVGPHVVAQPDGLCGCEPPYTAQRIGKRVISCECRAPNRLVDGQCVCPTGAQFIGGTCQCPLGTKVDVQQRRCVDACDNAAGQILDGATGKCVTCRPNERTVYVSGSVGQCQACAVGQKVSADHKSCIPACPPGQIVGGLHFGKDQTPDPGAGTCQTCPENTFASTEGPQTSKGLCLPCPADTYAKPGATQCLPLTCGPGSYRDPNDPHACRSCPPTQIYIPTEKRLTTGPDGKTIATVVAGHCGCGDNQVLQGATCQCAKGAVKVALPQAGAGLFACTCPVGARLDKKAGACLCPAGAKLDKSGKACLCPAGQRLEGEACVPATQVIKVPRDCARLGPRFINNPADPSTCLRCPAGQVADVERKACTAPKRPERPGVVAPPVSPPPAVRPPAVRPPSPALRCPSGMVPNAAGTACIRPVRKPETPPTLSRPPERRIVPRAGEQPDRNGRTIR